MGRVLAVALVLLALAAPAAAPAQTDPFGPLPQSAPSTPQPTPAPSSGADQSDIGRGVLLGIAGAVLLVFVGIGWYITRDARRNLTPEDRRRLEHVRTEEEKVRGRTVKKKARAAGKRQRQARKVQQRRR